ncbi:MAG: ankyrin repeat domain-containing protein [Candidatus Wallbacteria bacterium]|nr:ankyrin repeat domain-containing protein [Candidatus Wallbacteria bacterium]
MLPGKQSKNGSACIKTWLIILILLFSCVYFLNSTYYQWVYKTLFKYCVINNCNSAVELLLMRGNKPEKPFLNVLFKQCVESGNLAGVRTTLELGADPDTEGIKYTKSDCKTALIYAAHRNNLALAQILTDHNASINVTDYSGGSALIISLRNNLDFAVFLIKKGASLNTVYNGGKTALDIANAYPPEYSEFPKYQEVIKIMKSYGAKTALELSTGDTAEVHDGK